nr:hypothetical protein [Crateriforma conspicua]
MPHDEATFDPVVLRERFDDLLTVCNASGEDQHRSTIGREFHDFGARSRDERVIAGKPIDLVGHELAGPDMDPREVSTIDAGLRDQRTKESVTDQFLDANLVADMIEKMIRRTDHAAVQTEWCRGQADYTDMRVDNFAIGQELAIHPIALFADQMGFVDNNQIEGIKVACSFVNTLNAGNEDRRIGVSLFQASRIQANLDLGAQMADLVGVLLKQFFHVGED